MEKMEEKHFELPNPPENLYKNNFNSLAHWELNPGSLRRIPVIWPLGYSHSDVPHPKKAFRRAETFKNKLGEVYTHLYRKASPRHCPRQ